MSDTISSPRHRSPAYPAFSLRVAIEKIKQFYDAQKRNAVHVEVAKKTLGYDSKSSTGVRAVATLISYGLLDEDGSGTARKVRLTPDAYKIVNLTENDSDMIPLLQECAVKPSIYQQMIEEWPDGLPSDDAIRKFLTFEKQYNPEIVGQLIKDFKATYDFANLENHGILSGSLFDSEAPDGHIPTNNSHASDGWKTPISPSKQPTNNGYLHQQKVQEDMLMPPVNHAEIRQFTLPMFDGKVAILHAPLNLSEEDVQVLSESFEIIKKTLISKVKPTLELPGRPTIRTGPAMWRAKDADLPVVVNGYAGQKVGRNYVSIEGSDAGVPLDEIEYIEVEEAQ